MLNIKKIHYIINSVVTCLLIINIANASESFKLKNCEGKNILESESSLVSFKINNINGNKDIVIHGKSEHLEPTLLTESHAIFKSVKSGSWTLCIPGLTYSSVEVLETNLVSSKNYIIAGVAAATGGYLIGYSLDDSNNSAGEFSGQNTDEASSSTSSNTGTSSSSTAGSASHNNPTENDPTENEALLPDDSCSKTSTRSSSIRNGGCGGSPESLPDTAFN